MSLKKLPYFLCSSSLLLAGGMAPLSAQTAPAAPPPEVHLWDLWQQGGFVMYVLGIVWVLGMYFCFDAVMTLRAKKMVPPALVARLKEILASGNYQEAWTTCQANPCFLSTVLAAGLERIGRGKEAVDFGVEQAIILESMIIKTNITYLSVIGVVSPMIGLTGTVVGMINAFRTLSQNGITDPSKLAGNIGEVLVATASGLFVAIPGFIAFYFFRARAQVAIVRAEHALYKLLDDIPYDQLSGLRIGEDFSSATGAARGSKNVSQRVNSAVTTNCPSCQAPIRVGTTPCPNCKTVLDWGT
jgi:biopolymer transport protein ExbB